MTTRALKNTVPTASGEPTSKRAKSVVPLALIFSAAGIAHFVLPEWFDRIMPTWIPNARVATLLSGGAELAGALGLLLPATRVVAAWGLIALLIAVFPANIQMLNLARAAESSPLYVAILWARLPLQATLIWWVYSAAIKPSARLRM